MSELAAGDLVRIADSEYEMLIIGCADEFPVDSGNASSWFCVWEFEHRLFEEVFSSNSLILVRKERRRIPRGGQLAFPVHSVPTPLRTDAAK